MNPHLKKKISRSWLLEPVTVPTPPSVISYKNTSTLREMSPMVTYGSVRW